MNTLEEKHKIKKIFLMIAILAFSSLGFSTSVQAKEQSISTAPNLIERSNGDDFSFNVIQKTDDLTGLIGLGLRLFYDSSVLEFKGFTEVLSTDKIAFDSSPQDDTGNSDDSSDTDKFFGFSWGKISSGGWGISAEQKILSATFAWKDSADKSTTTIRFSSTSVSSGYTFSSSELTINGPRLPAVAAQSNVVNDTLGSISADEMAQFTLNFKDSTGAVTDNLGGKVVSLRATESLGNISFGTISSDGKIIATYTPNGDSVGIHSGLQFMLGLESIGMAQTVTVTKGQKLLTIVAADHGLVSSKPVGINCSEDCTASYLQDTDVTLTAIANVGYRFNSWGDDCSGANNPLVVRMTSAKSCSALFTSLEADDDADGYNNDKDAFPNDPNEWLDTDKDGTGNNADTDDDNDGLPDTWEEQYGLDPLNDSDGDMDSDGDGLSNLDEYRQGSDPTTDTVPPVFASVKKVELNALGRRTGFALADFSVLATDAKDGAVLAKPQAVNGKPVTLKANKLILASGRHTLLWQAKDAAANVVTVEQTVDVLPQVNFVVKQQGSAGQTLLLKAMLSGVAPVYPIIVPFTVSGSAAANAYALDVSEIIITEKTQGEVEVKLLQGDFDKTVSETIIFTMGDISRAVQGKNTTHTLTILADNASPQIVGFSVEQNNLKNRLLSQDKGLVTVRAEVFDPNGDTLSYQWSSDYFTNSVTDGNAALFQFDPVQVKAGKYTLQLEVSDGEFSLTRSVRVHIVSSQIVHIDDTDSDGDGILDKDEANDEDSNGIADYQEQPHEANEMAVGQDKVIRSPVGTKVLLGVMGTASGQLSVAEMEQYHTDNSLSAYRKDIYSPLAIYDYSIAGLAGIGESVAIIIELASSLPQGALLRKYSLESGDWVDFVTNEKNTVASLSMADGTCPDNANTVWQLGLVPGANCLKLMIEDGGANDADGVANGSIDDPIAVSTAIAYELSASNISLDNTSLKRGDGEQVVLSFSLSVSAGGTSLYSLTLENSVELNNIQSLTLYYDADGNGTVEIDKASEKIAESDFDSSSRELSFVLNSPIFLQSGSTRFLITYDVN